MQNPLLPLDGSHHSGPHNSDGAHHLDRTNHRANHRDGHSLEEHDAHHRQRSGLPVALVGLFWLGLLGLVGATFGLALATWLRDQPKCCCEEEELTGSLQAAALLQEQVCACVANGTSLVLDALGA